MLMFGQQLIGKAILSLRTGTQIGEIREPLINPANLKIEGWYVNGPKAAGKRILLTQDIRDLIPQGFVVNDLDSLTAIDELIRLRELIDLNFELIGKNVRTENKQKLGKVSDFTFNKNDSFIQKLYISQSIVKSLSGGQAIVDRTQIIEISDKQIVVSDATLPGKVMASPNVA